VKQKLFSITLLLVVALAACTRVPSTTAVPSTTPTALPPTPTEEAPPAEAPTAEAPTPAPTLPPAEAPTAEAPAELGGVEVALALIVIPDQEIIARVNEEEITTVAYQAELERALSAVTAQYMVDWNDTNNHALLPMFQEQVLSQIVEQTLLRQLADQEEISVDPEAVETEVALIQAQVEQDSSIADWESFLAENSLTEQSLRDLIADGLLTDALIELHGGSPVAEHVHASHILVETEETGQEVLDKLEAGEEFGDLAAEYSMDPGSKDQGGDLDWFPRGMMVPEFEEAAFALEAGETSGLVQTDYGYHIIQVHAKEEREIDADLFAQVQQQQFQVWFEARQAEASIERLYAFDTPE
jgi:foldase protein PrsA